MELLPIPITPHDFAARILAPGLALLPRHMDTPAARVMLTTICLQESAFDSRLGSRWQVINAARREIKGPARGLAQFELGGGVVGVYKHAASAEMTREVCRARDVRLDPRDIWAALDRDDLLAVALARLLLWTDPAPLPAPEPSAQSTAFSYYLRVWRPGAWHNGSAKSRDALRKKWLENWGKALAANQVTA
jgi:hypothetical protein